MSGIAIDDGEEILGLQLGAAPDDQRQTAIAVFDKRLEYGAVGGNDADAAVLLPQRESLPLGDGDLQPIGIELEDGRIGDPRIRHQAGPRGVGIEKKKRGPAGHAGGGENVFAADFLRSGQRNRRDTKAERVGGFVAGILQPSDDVGDMTAGDHAVAERGGQQQDGGGDADAGRRRHPHDARQRQRPKRRR